MSVLLRILQIVTAAYTRQTLNMRATPLSLSNVKPARKICTSAPLPTFPMMDVLRIRELIFKVILVHPSNKKGVVASAVESTVA